VFLALGKKQWADTKVKVAVAIVNEQKHVVGKAFFSKHRHFHNRGRPFDTVNGKKQMSERLLTLSITKNTRGGRH